MTEVTKTKEEEFTGRFDLGLWKKLLGAVGRYRRRLIVLCAQAAVLAVLDSLFPLLTRNILNEVAQRGPQAALMPYVIAYAVMACVFGAMVKIFISLAGGVSVGVSHDVRQQAFEHLQDLSFSFYDRRPAGWLIARLTSDCDRLSRTLAWGSLDVIWGGCLVAAVSVNMLLQDWRLGLMILATVPVLIVASLAFQKRILAAYRDVRKANSTITAGYSECIAGVRTTKTLVREDTNAQEFAGLTNEMYGHSVRSAVLSSAYFPTIMLVTSAGTGLALWAGGLWARAGTMQIGTLVMFIHYAALLSYPVLEMARVFADLQATQAAAERVFGLIDTVPEVKDSPEVAAAIAARQASPAAAGLAADGLPDRIGSVEFRHVAFAYGAGEPVLHDFSLAVPSGQTVALVGPTGGGKTTVVSLLARFYEPTAGQILLDGVEYRKRSLSWWQSGLGIVLQQPHLFSGTIRENIRYGRLTAADEEIVEAAKLVRAHDFIEALPDGYETQVGEGGSRLATGQKQLVSFARAVLADPKIFIMDEATSSIDTETEQRIQAGLAAILKGRISFLIAHRLSTIRSADRIVVVDGGRIVEQGPHRELIARRERYYELYTNQFAEERTAAVLGTSLGVEE